ncbi:MAG: UDP-N-acetylmuramate dehydrogenase [Acidimicrobiia bacterium]
MNPGDVERVIAELGTIARPGEPVGARTTYRVGGNAAVFVEAEAEDDLISLGRVLSKIGAVPVLVLGRGSNLLIADEGFDGVVVTLGEGFSSISIEGTSVRAGGATSLPVLARRTAAVGLTGLEWAVGVPGSVGGAVRMNAGGHGAETVETLRRYRVVSLTSGEARDHDVGDLQATYRHTSIAPCDVVVWGEYQLAVGDRDRSEAQISEIVRWRRENQPGGQNAGSVFTNPPGDSAGRLIEAAGLKGFRVGSAFVSPKHANFFQADEGGSANDVRALILEVQRRVEEVHGVRLQPELRMVGFSDEASP